MALTPDDVVHKRFETTRFRDGYDQDEVDDFLDEVVTELRRLTEENDTLRAENEQLKQGGAVAAPVERAESERPVAEAPVIDTAELDALRAENEQLKTQLAEREAAAVAEAPAAEPVQQPEAAEAPAEVVTAAPQEAAAPAVANADGLLALAQRVHDEHVAAGERRRDELIAEAEQTAQQIEDDAQLRKETLAQEFEAQKAKLDEQKTGLEQKIDELKSFERDYRLKLRGYIESQLRDLDRSSSLAFGGQGGS
ncbi:DivIVA domain-containing protein [Agrococcus beijingensis]|uniref:DivIVA domain-containing protein n=1 Tax=Agrococcus beijingensis TaxID=3068634 RepID=UPI00274162A1|nr:DivIVA domain-containing protein [Agrococcus sp. REN33]